jgi:hypothetical protein
MIMNSTRFYRPRLAQLTGKELMFAQESLDKDYRYGTELDIPDFDFAAPRTMHPIKTRRVAMKYTNRPTDFEPEFFDMGAFQITYNFSSAIRKNNFPLRGALPFNPKATGEYGASGFSFRLLYEFLCESYNNNAPFIDTYFNQIFKTRQVYTDFKDIYNTIQDDINGEQLTLFMGLPLKTDGTPDMRYTESKKFMDFKVWQDPIIGQDCKNLAAAIRHDIIVCLSTGRIPLRKKTVSGKTQKRRAMLLNLDPNRFFFASGQLINHLNIYVEIGDREAV